MNSPAFHAEEHEHAVLGACLLGGAVAASEALATLPMEELFNPVIQEAMLLVQGLVDSGQPVDIATMGRAWRQKNGNRPAPIEVWSKAPEYCPSEASLPFHVAEVREAAHRRKIRDVANKLALKIGDPVNTPADVISEFEQAVTVTNAQDTAIHARDLCTPFIAETEARFEAQGKLSGVATGLHVLDSMLDGIQLGELTVIGARPSIGKTALGVTIAHHAAVENGIPTLFVTCEMSPKALMRRLTCLMADVPLKSVRDGRLKDADFRKLTSALARVKRSTLIFENCLEKPTISSITARIWRHVRINGVKLVIVDYLQKIKPTEKQEKRTYEVAEVSGRLKAVAVNSGVAMLALAQLNRESENDKERLPRLTDLADSGQIERDADVVGLLHRSRNKDPEKAVLIIGKQRDGETGPVPLHFHGPTCRFTAREDDEQQPTMPSYGDDN